MMRGLGYVMTENALVKCTVKQREKRRSMSRVMLRSRQSEVAYVFNLGSVHVVNVYADTISKPIFCTRMCLFSAKETKEAGLSS